MKVWVLFVLSLVVLSAYGKNTLPPSIVTAPKDYLVAQNEKALLQCNATGVPKPFIEWFDGKNPLFPAPGFNEYLLKSDGKPDKTRLQLTSTTTRRGPFTCRAKNKYGTTCSSPVTVSQKYTHDFKTEHLKIKPAITTLGWESLALPCNKPDANPKSAIITWVIMESYGEITARVVSNVRQHHRIMVGPNGTLYFAYTTHYDATPDGQAYVCQYNNPAHGTIKQGSPAQVKIKPNPNAPNFGPTWMLVPENEVVAIEKDFIDLYCIASARPTGPVTWKRLEGKKIPTNHSYEVDGTHLYLKNAAASYAGKYECTVPDISGGGAPLKHVWTVKIETRPKFKVKPVDSTYVIGETAKLTCSAEGNPKPKTEWLVNMKTQDTWPVENRLTVTNGDTMTYELKDLRRGGEGSNSIPDMRVVQCRAANKHGTILASGFINVVWPLNMTYPPPGEIKKDKKEALLQCNATVIAMNIEWSHEDTISTYSTEWKHSENTLHIITSEKIQDTYTCVTTSSGQRIEGSIKLKLSETEDGARAAPGLKYLYLLMIICVLMILGNVLFFVYCVVYKKHMSRKNEKVNKKMIAQTLGR